MFAPSDRVRGLFRVNANARRSSDHEDLERVELNARMHRPTMSPMRRRAKLLEVIDFRMSCYLMV